MAQPKPGAKTVRVTAENIVGHKKKIMQGQQELKLKGLESPKIKTEWLGRIQNWSMGAHNKYVLRNQNLIVVLEITYIEDILRATHWVKQYMDYLIYLFL